MSHSVETRSGRIEGTREAGCSVYRGVPFAAPPVAARRFRAPVPEKPWSGVRAARRFRAAPPQSHTTLLEKLGMTTPGPYDEDCLTLNVWTPAIDGGRRPVLVWLHGGAYLTGGGSSALFDGRRLALRGDAVVVTLNYRVGALGFLYLDGLGDPALTGANFGLQDQLAALHWVREHAASFGGDPENLTVFGESAGAGSLCALLSSPAARGSFQRAIVQSAAPNGVLDPEEATRRTRRLLEILEIEPAELSEVPAARLVAAQSACAAERSWKTGMFFAPVIDGSFLPDLPSRAIAAGSAREVELMIGTTRDELQLYKLGAAPATMSDEVLAAALGAQLPGTGPDGRPHAQVLAESYRSIRSERGESTDPMDLIFAVQTDLAMRMPAIRLAEDQARVQPRTWMYLFEWASPIEGGVLGACHALDVPFTFGNLRDPTVRNFSGAGPEAEALADAIADAWTGFARDGDPGHPTIGAWPTYTSERRDTMSFGASCGSQRAPRDEERRLWERILPRP